MRPTDRTQNVPGRAHESDPRPQPDDSDRTAHLRQKWERIYEAGNESNHFWFVDRLPDEVVALLEETEVVKGCALDVGCGAGILTMLLAGHFQAVAGIDIAESGIRRAFDAAQASDPAPHFVVGDATGIPFANDGFDYVLDRGCLHLIARERWPDYFADVERVMKVGGRFQLFIPLRGRPRGLLAACRHYLRNPMRVFGGSRRSIARVLAPIPPTLVCETAGIAPISSRAGYALNYIHIICRKS